MSFIIASDDQTKSVFKTSEVGSEYLKTTGNGFQLSLQMKGSHCVEGKPVRPLSTRLSVTYYRRLSLSRSFLQIRYGDFNQLQPKVVQQFQFSAKLIHSKVHTLPYILSKFDNDGSTQ
jgi:hypothetical protein